MAKFNTGQSFADGDTVTGAKLNNITSQLNVYTGVISEQTAMVATVSTADQLLIADTDNGDSGAANRVTVQKLLNDTLTNGTYTNAQLSGNLNVTQLSTLGTISSTTGTITTLNSTTATIPTLTSITKITSGTGTAAAPAISPTGDTNTGIFFPTADTVAFAEGGAEAMRINSSGQVGIGTNTPAYLLNLQNPNTSSGPLFRSLVARAGDEVNFFRTSLVYNDNTASSGMLPGYSSGLYYEKSSSFPTSGGLVLATGASNGPVIIGTNDTERMRIDSSGNVGIGITPTTKLNVYDASNALALVQGDANAQVIVNRASTDATSPVLALRKSRGSVASPAAVATSDNIGDLAFQAFGGTTTRIIARVRGNVDAYVSDSDISSNLIFQTSAAGGITPTEKIRIGPSGQIGIGGANYGTSGQVLTSGGSVAAPSWQTASGITSGTAVASTSGTAIDLTGIPSTAKRITVMFDGVSTDGNSDLLIQLGISSGIVATGYASSGGNVYSLNGCGAAGSTSGFVIVAGGPPTIRNGSMVITNISGNTWISSHAMGTSDNGGGQAGGGSKSLSATLDRIRITTVNGTDAFDAGSINIIYEG